MLRISFCYPYRKLNACATPGDVRDGDGKMAVDRDLSKQRLGRTHLGN
jgi:hypothetical protein